TRPSLKVILELLPEFFDKCHSRHRCGIAQRAKCPSQHVFRKVIHVVDIFFKPSAGMEANQSFLQPIGSFTTRDAPATTFMLIKLHGPQGKLYDASCLV